MRQQRKLHNSPRKQQASLFQQTIELKHDDTCTMVYFSHEQDRHLVPIPKALRAREILAVALRNH